MNSGTSEPPLKANEEDREEGGKGRKRQNYANDDRMSDAVNEWFRQENQSGSTGKPLRTKKQSPLNMISAYLGFKNIPAKTPASKRNWGHQVVGNPLYRKTPSNSFLTCYQA